PEPGAPARSNSAPPIAHVPSAALVDRYRPKLSNASQQTINVTVIARSTFIGSLLDLPGVVAEVDGIKAQMKGHRLALYEQDLATRANVLESLQSSDIVHIATHAFSNPDNARSGVVLSDGAGGDDLLLAAEIASLQMNAEVVMLSACSSALGRLSHGEGL